MGKSLRRRFWVQTVLAGITGLMTIVTLLWRDWIEILFDSGPDQGSGAFEWLIVGVLALVTIILAVAARYEFRRVAPAS
ncbi:ABC transporter permease [Kibdelosporangium persicum]|uniref:ABC transporter permease n=1 Tax=Kibdelosporangium persicum TaxID=2698649 RepID=A0ABX2FGM5_9PSEU|nr:ABC transporter permease [Kibdelosporangium persicum]NRN69885.1 ABC transporter permease [Kibdelosporangium persicum]